MNVSQTEDGPVHGDKLQQPDQGGGRRQWQLFENSGRRSGPVAIGAGGAGGGAGRPWVFGSSW